MDDQIADAYAGVGGAYVRDPKTGIRTPAVPSPSGNEPPAASTPPASVEPPSPPVEPADTGKKEK